MTDARPPVPRGRVRRTMPLAGFTARAAGGRVVAALREKTGNGGAVGRFHERTAERYAELLGHSKGVLMKAGQMFSLVDAGTVGDGELSPYQRALSRLQADAPPMAPALARHVVEADLGRPVGQVFAEFADEPMAAASIGQVHRAVLPDRRQVAVKIQYPGVAEAIRADLANTELLTTVFRFASAATGPLPDLRQAAREISARISEEVDYRHEAANITAFATLYRDHPFIVMPEVIPQASGDRVLTMTYLDGLDFAAAQHADQDLKDTWAEVICRMTAGCYRVANLMHADPHPGNYRFMADGRVGFLDFGCVIVLPELARFQMVTMMRAAIEGRKADLWALMAESGYFAPDSSLTAEDTYRWWIASISEMVSPQPFTYTRESIDRVTQSLFDVRPADHPLRRMSAPPAFVFFPRLAVSMNAVFAALGATLYTRAIVDDMDGVAEPVTELGKQHVAWIRQRGLPFGMDPRRDDAERSDAEERRR